MALGAFILAGITASLWLLPWLIREAYEGRSAGFLNRLMASKHSVMPVGHYVSKVRLLGVAATFGIPLAAATLAMLFQDAKQGSPRARRFVLPASAASLAGMRIGVCAIALVMAAIEDVSSAALLPRWANVAPDMGVMTAIRKLPLGEAFLASPLALETLELLTLLALVSAMIGFKARVAVLLSLFGVLLSGGVLRMYTHFFHTGLLPIYLLGVLAITPCADAWSVDAFLKRRAGLAVIPSEARSMRYGWPRFTLWCVIALSYFAAGTSKLRHGGFFWWDGVNLKAKVLGDALNIGSFDLPFAPFFARLPAVAFAPLGLGALIVELGFISVPFSARARKIFPLLAIGLHAGIFLAQEILFLDLMLVQLLFFDYRPWLVKLERWARPHFPGIAELIAPTTNYDHEVALGKNDARHARPPVALMLIPFVYCASIVLAVEAYPITTWGMYSDRTTSTIVKYIEFRGIDARERRVNVRFEDTFGVLRFSRTYDIIPHAFGPQRQHELRQLLDQCAKLYNREVPPEARLVGFEFDLRAWDFEQYPSDANRGVVQERFVHRVATQ